jgi:hypothetical protein
MLFPPKPTINGEPAYEDIPVAFWEFIDWQDPMRVPGEVLDENLIVDKEEYFEKGFFTGYDVRVMQYWDMLSGTAGFAYGNNAVWQMFKKNGPVIIPCLYDWRESLDRPGSESVIHLKNLFLSRPFYQMVPDQSVIFGVKPDGENMIKSAVAKDGSFMLVYLAKGQKVSVGTQKLSDDDINGWWYNPRNGEALEIGVEIEPGIQEFYPPTNGYNNDWLLVLDAEKAKLNKPGEL